MGLIFLKLPLVSMIYHIPDPGALYSFTNPVPNQNGQINQPAIVDSILKQKQNGFYIECGAFDGEVYSNTLFFEMQRNWTGLLIEANKAAFQNLRGKNRKVGSKLALILPMNFIRFCC